MYCFIFGKNPQLSLAEILSYFEMEGILFKFIDLTEQMLAVDADFDPEKVITDLGGTLKIVPIEKEFSWDDFGKQEFTEEEKNTTVSVYGPIKMVRQIKKVFNSLARKLILENSEMVKRKMSEVCIIYGLKKCYFGKTVAVSDPYDYKDRDEKRPHVDYLKISPSRARILVNLAQAKESLFDPFCGVGTIAQEAILRDVGTVYCSDVSEKAIAMTKKNLEWTKSKYWKRARVITKKADVRHKSFENVQSVATEPDLGPALKDRPQHTDAKKILQYLTDNYDHLFRNIYYAMKNGGRAAVIFPCIFSRSGKIFMDKHYNGFQIIDLFEKIPKEYKDTYHIRSNCILDAEREKNKSRITIREFGVFKVIKK